MIRRPPRSTHCISSAASDVYKRQLLLIVLFQFTSHIACQEATIQDNDATDDISESEIPEQSQQFQSEEQMNKPTEEQIQQMIQNLYTVCIIISKHQINSLGKDTLDSLLKRFDKQNEKLDLFNRIMVDHVKECTKSLEHSKLQEVIQELQERKFEISKYQHLFSNIPMETYKSISNIEFTAEDKQILKIVEDLEKRWEQQQQKESDKLEDLDGELVWSGDSKDKDDEDSQKDICLLYTSPSPRDQA
eukprot:TRINITY_DN6159_c0_g1_i2.p1 TRINITY_DN6159_c0_g1~~TRINITY_DN6159_c0_g1_i2.p1  ORF type:complete len:247 (-),score=78.76 TRINITY_DN6159_c0_g1_i2:89-829(-)